MINKETTLTAEWLESVSTTIGAKDKLLVEKTIRASILLEGSYATDNQSNVSTNAMRSCDRKF